MSGEIKHFLRFIFKRKYLEKKIHGKRRVNKEMSLLSETVTQYIAHYLFTIGMHIFDIHIQ